MVDLVESLSAIPGLPGGSINYQGNPSNFPKRTPMVLLLWCQASPCGPSPDSAFGAGQINREPFGTAEP